MGTGAAPSAEAGVQAILAAGGLGLSVTRLDGPEATPPPEAAGLVRLGVHADGPRPETGLDAFDILLTASPAAAPWVVVPAERLETEIAHLNEVVARQPLAAAVAAQILRTSLKLSLDEALVQESMGYSMLLASAPFRAWRSDRPPRPPRTDDDERVRLFREGEDLHIRLNRPQARNAVDARMRDALVEALEFAVLDPDVAPVFLSGEGPAFCAGGDLDEFGRAADPGAAHTIRVLQSAARLAAQLGPRLTARLHGACVGAGIEMPAAAGRIVARPGATFRLPEVGMGLIPGAGGTATIPRRVGRHRAAWMALSGHEIDLATALDWGLVDSVDEAP